jgi:hypothetical protein
MSGESGLDKLPWYKRPWKASEKHLQARRLAAIASDFASRGMLQSGPRVAAQNEALADLGAARLRSRVLLTLVLVVALAAGATAFSDNRLLEAVEAGAVAAAVPAALYLGLRRDAD